MMINKQSNINLSIYKPVNIKEALQEAAYFLRERDLEQPRLEAEALLASVLQRERIYLYLHGDEELLPEAAALFRDLVKRRGERTPLAYLTGEKEFMGLSFAVTEGVLIPRPETEHLVEAVIAWVKEMVPERGVQILDLGTGCGNIVVSLLHFLPGVRAMGIDLEEIAVELTRRNALSLGVCDRLTLCWGRYWRDLEIPDHKFQVIVSNPPYIPATDLAFLPAEVTWEPRLALDGGEDGLEAYGEIFSKIHLFLAAPGLLALEVGYGQAEDVLKMADRCCPGFFQRAEVRQDYAGIDRIVLLQI